MILEVQQNLRLVIGKADEISQEFRRKIHVDMTTQKGIKLSLLKELLEIDNFIRDVLAELRQAVSIIKFSANREEILKQEEFLKGLHVNLASMFRSFDRISKVMEFDEKDIDSLVIDTIDSLNELSSFTDY